jgi:hypothetical protein|tara:strand:+ start:254 stop:445 length:192 start_codon:yes stop_codon:yes gene_type:complete
MKMDDLPKINCTTVVTYRNTKTGEVFKDKKEGEDIVQDVTVQVSPKGLEILQKVMKKHNEPNS